jgi:iron complex transport system ATP-binding protein
MEKIVEMRNVRAWRGSTLALQDLTFTLARGEHTAVLGPNGSGKSTLLRLLTREVLPEHRQPSVLRLFGRERWDVWELRSRLGIVSHDLQVEYSPGATGLNVVLSGFRSTPGIWSGQRFEAEEERRARRLLERLELLGLAEERYSTMSTGEQRRLLLARALVHDPEVLVLDEPTSGLDPKACFQYLEIVRALAREGKTIILVTHHVHEIPPEVRRAILLKGGRVVADGPKEGLLTSERLSELFDTRLEVVRANGYYQLLPAGTAG